MDLSTPATYTLGPDAGRLTVTTGTAGPAARAGHDLTLVATSWEATLTLTGQEHGSALTLSADPWSLVVVDGRGGASSLSDADREGITATVRQEVLSKDPIRFQSTDVSHHPDDDRLEVTGILELAGVRRPISFAVRHPAAARLVASITLRQTDYGIAPYTVLFGALKVADELAISVDVELGAS
ncbi:MAG: YceI family protein [Acidobacteriota bacterium]|nr:YceI family protein [Acidobacteriota bacterium]